MAKDTSNFIGKIGNVALLNWVGMVFALKENKQMRIEAVLTADFYYDIEFDISTSLSTVVLLFLINLTEIGRIYVKNPL